MLGEKQKNIHEIAKINLGHGDYGDIRSKLSSSLFEHTLPICTSNYSKKNNAFIIELNIERATISDVAIFKDYIKLQNAASYGKVVLDLTKTIFLDSTFLGAIVGFLKKIKSNGNQLSLVVDFNKVKILTPFEQLKNILNIYPTVDEALSEIR